MLFDSFFVLGERYGFFDKRNKFQNKSADRFDFSFIFSTVSCADISAEAVPTLFNNDIGGAYAGFLYLEKCLGMPLEEADIIFAKNKFEVTRMFDFFAVKRQGCGVSEEIKANTLEVSGADVQYYLFDGFSDTAYIQTSSVKDFDNRLFAYLSLCLFRNIALFDTKEIVTYSPFLNTHRTKLSIAGTLLELLGEKMFSKEGLIKIDNHPILYYFDKGTLYYSI